MRDDNSWATTSLRAVMAGGAAWCGAVLSIVYGHSENVRWWSALAASPILVVLGLSLFTAPSQRRAKIMLALTIASALLLLFCAGLVIAGHVELTEGGRLRRAAAALSTIAIALECRRLFLLTKIESPG